MPVPNLTWIIDKLTNCNISIFQTEIRIFGYKLCQFFLQTVKGKVTMTRIGTRWKIMGGKPLELISNVSMPRLTRIGMIFEIIKNFVMVNLTTETGPEYSDSKGSPFLATGNREYMGHSEKEVH
jgi:hypothetical protein